MFPFVNNKRIKALGKPIVIVGYDPVFSFSSFQFICLHHCDVCSLFVATSSIHSWNAYHIASIEPTIARRIHSPISASASMVPTHTRHLSD